jgi:general secretion pathway protein J
MRRRGFTLLEVLVALIIAGLLLVGLTAGLRMGSRVGIGLDRARTAAADLDGVDWALRGLIAGADPVAPIRGTAGTLTFVTRPPEGIGVTSALAEMVLGVDARHRFVLRWMPRAPGGGPPPAAMHELVLLEGVERIDLSFWDPGPGRWEPAWTRRPPPALVRIRLVFPAGQGRHWPDIVVAPMVPVTQAVGPHSPRPAGEVAAVRRLPVPVIARPAAVGRWIVPPNWGLV